MKKIRRVTQSETLDELARNLEFIISYEKRIRLSANDIKVCIQSAGVKSKKPLRLTYDKSTRQLSLFLFDPLTSDPVAGLGVILRREPEPDDLKFCADYMRVFNSDITTAPHIPETNELWIALQQTRFARSIGRFSPFSTENFMNWLRVVESAGSLRYEGHPFSACILMTKQMQWIENSNSVRFSKFPTNMRFQHAILQEKWIRAILRDPGVGLVGLSLAGAIVGAVTFQGLLGAGKAFAPHENLIPISSAIVPGTMAFVSAAQGDLYVLFPSGATFVKTQGRWRYLNYAALTEFVAQLLPKAIAPHVVRIILDLSFERRGGLIAILENKVEINKVVPDHSVHNRVNRSLRSFAAKLKITDESHRRLVRSGAAIDGAIVLSKNGDVLDLACMIGEPEKSDYSAVGKVSLERFAGARSTAAWNASIYGVAIKISEDGPITIFRKGDLVLQFG